MVKGYCPNHECPNIDVLDAEHPCPTCGRDVEELSPREYWRTRTIKMMHAHEIAEIAEIQEVARRALGEASLIPKAQKSEDTTPRQEQERAEEVASADATETLPTPDESSSDKVELVSTLPETERVAEVEELMPSATAGTIREEASEQQKGEELEIANLDTASESPPDEEKGLEESKVELGREVLESEAAERFIVEIPELGIDRVSERQDESTSDQAWEEGASVTEAFSEVDEVPFVEGLVGARPELESEEEELIKREPRESAETLASGEVSEAQEIAELEDSGESPGEAAETESPEWKPPESLYRESTEEVSAPVDLPVEGGVERPTSPVRIITFREGGTEIGICPYCGRFVRGSDLARHKLKHRVRNVFGLQAGD